MRVAWLQKGGEVNDEHFKSYIPHRRRPKTSKFSNAVHKFIRASSNPDTGLLIRESRRGSPKGQGYLTMLAVAISLGGFVLQFVELRALTWQVTIAQLVATGVMTGLRVLVRRNLIQEPEGKEIKVSGYELEAMAMEISGCNHWDVTTWESGPSGGLVGIGNSHVAESSVPAGGSGLPPTGPDSH